MNLNLFFLLFFISLVIDLHSQSAGPRLIVRGDDMGFSHSGNMAMIEAFKNGIEKSIEVIVPSAWFPEAVILLNDHPGIDVGVHLVLTSEWDNIKYRPLTHPASLVNEDGYFYPFIYPHKNYPNQSIMDHKYKLADVEQEFRAQIEMAKRHIRNLTHISGHMGCTDMDSEVKALSKRLAKEYGLDIHPEDFGVKNVTYIGLKGTSKEKIQSLKAILLSLEPNETYLFIDHPGMNDSELRAIYHKGYENVAEDRAGVLQAWTDKSIKKIISQKGIQLISYADLIGSKQQLFNGKDHNGWHVDVPAMDKDPNMKSPFIIRDGKMVSLAHTGGHIITDAIYENYRLNIDYRFAGEPGNCGVLVHASVPRRLYGMFPQSIEVQMMHENAGDFWCIGEDISVPDMTQRRGPKENWGVDGDKKRRIINLNDGAEKPLGQWNHMQIECFGKEIKVWVNGILVNHGHNATASKGQIALQAEGSEVEFRTVSLTMLK